MVWSRSRLRLRGGFVRSKATGGDKVIQGALGEEYGLWPKQNQNEMVARLVESVKVLALEGGGQG
jgi:hypothetical protein